MEMNIKYFLVTIVAALCCLSSYGQPARQAKPEKFIDFKAVQPDGKEVKLSDYLGKGKLVLVDFWASWCGPCREEIPTLKDVYYEFKGEKFDIIGVPVFDRVASTLETVKEFKMPWTQVLNMPEKLSEAYGFNYIPYIILVGPDGTILETNLRGDGIRAAVKKHLASETKETK